MPGPVGRHLSAEVKAALRRELLANPDETASSVAMRVGVNKSTAEKMRRALKKEGLLAEPTLEVKPRETAEKVEAEKPTPAHERRIIELEDRLREANNKLKDLHRNELSDDAIREILGIIARAPTSPPDWTIRVPAGTGKRTPEVPVTIWSDWHLAEVVEPEEVNGVNAYNIEIAERRIRRLFDSTVDLCANHGPGEYPGIVINLLGDFVSGSLHPELAKSDEEEVLPAMLRCRDILVAGLTRMADTFGRVYAPCASGNHGRQTPKPEFKRYAYKNFDWVIYQLLMRHFADDPRVHIDVRPSNEVHYKVYHQRFLAMHGDMLGVKGGDGIIAALGPIARGEVKVRGHSASYGQEYDMLLMGHWHQSLWLPRVTVANCLKGFDEYAKNALRAPVSEPSQPLFFVHPRRGITSRWEVKVDDPKPAAKDWVSWSEVAA